MSESSSRLKTALVRLPPATTALEQAVQRWLRLRGGARWAAALGTVAGVLAVAAGGGAAAMAAGVSLWALAAVVSGRARRHRKEALALAAELRPSYELVSRYDDHGAGDPPRPAIEPILERARQALAAAEGTVRGALPPGSGR